MTTKQELVKKLWRTYFIGTLDVLPDTMSRAEQEREWQYRGIKALLSSPNLAAYFAEMLVDGVAIELFIMKETDGGPLNRKSATELWAKGHLKCPNSEKEKYRKQARLVLKTAREQAKE